MDNQDKHQEFTRGKTMSLKMSLSSEQHNMLKEWSASIPTLYMLDICVVGATKLTESALEKDPRKAKLVTHLRELDRRNNCFSYLFALMEKVSDSRERDTEAELQGNILADLSAMRKFFKKARVLEPDDFVINFFQELRCTPIETKRPDYLLFLKELNNHLKLGNPVSSKYRLQKAKKIIEKADALNISKHHPIVMIGFACLYGNLAAKKLMKFKDEPKKFDAENALADIMLISRFADIQSQIEHIGRNKNGCQRANFITDDSGLIEIIKCFEPSVVKHKDTDEGRETEITMTVNLEKLITEIEPAEYDCILDLLN